MFQISYVVIGRVMIFLVSIRSSLFFHRFIPRRIDLDCDFALDMLVKQNQQTTSQLITANKDAQRRGQRRSHKRTNHQEHTNSAKKTLELLEYVMPQNKRIYNFGVKTLQPRPIGISTSLFFFSLIDSFFQIQVISHDKSKH